MLFGTSDVRLEKYLLYLLFAETWGWTPAEVDEMDTETVYIMKTLLEEINKEKNRQLSKGADNGRI